MTPSSKFWLVWRVGSDSPNVRHDKSSAACAEAERLALKHVDQRFIVMEAVAEYEAVRKIQSRNII